MEATVAAPVPPSQTTALLAQTSPKNNKVDQSPTKINLSATREASKAVTSVPCVQNITLTTYDSQQITVASTQPLPTLAASQTSWQRAQAVDPASSQQTLPEVQDFLQKAFETVQRSQQNALSTAQTTLEINCAQTPPKIDTAIKQTTQNTGITTQQSPPSTVAMPHQPPYTAVSTDWPSAVKSSGVVREMLPPHTEKSISAQTVTQATVANNIRQPYYASQVGQTSNISPQIDRSTVTKNTQYSYYTSQAGHTPNISVQLNHSTGTRNVQYTPFYASQTGNSPSTSQTGLASTTAASKENQSRYSETNWQGKPKNRQGQDSQKRSLLVAKRRQSPTVPKTGDSSVTEDAEVTQKAKTSSVSEDSSSNESPQPAEAQNSGASKEAESKLLPQTPPAQTSSQDLLTTALSPKESPSKHGTSRVAQTYQAFKAFHKDRGSNGAQTSVKAKSNNAQSQQSNASGPSRTNGPTGRNSVPKVPEPDPKKRVLVSGFPPYTQGQDLVRVLRAFGGCYVDKCRNRLAVVTFESEVAAKSAIKASDEICIYGEFIEITPYTNARHVDDLFKAYKKVISTQKGQDIIQPNNIDLTGDFYQQLENIQNGIRLTREQVQAITNLYVDLEMVLQQEWPGCVAIPFGSIPTGLGIKSSDADCFVELPAALRRRGAAGGAAAFVLRARRLLANYPRVFAQLVAIPRANTPIVKFRHVPSGFHCDVSSKTPLGAQNSKLIKLLLERDARLAPFAVLVKYWAKVHELSGTGRLTNYALTMMVVFYLQQPPVALAPPVEALQRDPATHFIVDHWNAGFAPRRAPAGGAPTSAPVPDLLGGFFEFYASFDFDELVVCPYLGAPVRKALFDEPDRLPAEFSRYVANVRDNLASPIRCNTAFCVQDPFEQSHNVASAVCGKLAADVRAYFKFAADAYAADRAGCGSFLRTILLQRPKIRRERAAPATKIFLIPRIRAEIADPDWRARVREVLLETIFEGILKIRLERDREREARELADEDRREAEWKERERRRAERRGRAPEEDVDRSARMDKEKYSGSATKPVWVRRKNYSLGALEPTEALVTRQRRTTEVILGSAADVLLQFQLELAFRDRPKHCYVYARMVDGDLNAFRGFVGFLHSVMFDWFRMLIRPYLAPPKAGGAGYNVELEQDDDAEYVDEDPEDVDEDPEDVDEGPGEADEDPEHISRDMRAVSLTDTDTESTDSSKRDLTDIH